MKVVGSGSMFTSEKGRKFLFLQCRSSTGSNFGSVKRRAMKFACNMGFWDMVNRMV